MIATRNGKLEQQGRASLQEITASGDWANKNITDIGAKLWDDYLISKGIFYISDFLNENNQVLDYQDFVRQHSINRSSFTRSDYLPIKMAIRRYNCPSVVAQSIEVIDVNINLQFFNKVPPNKGQKIRSGMYSPDITTNELAPLVKWNEDMGVQDTDWEAVFSRLCRNLSNNFKLLQFQYKLLMKISTCRYMRFKMNIEKDSPYCSKCNKLETLDHIFLKCPHTLNLVQQLNTFIRVNLEPTYIDNNMFFFVTCMNNNRSINFLNLCAKWYISRAFQQDKLLQWMSFVSLVKRLLVGERKGIVEQLESLL